MKILTLAPGREPTKLTAQRPSKTLGEHAVAFKSRNGYEVEPPPDTSGEINGVISELVLMKYVTHLEILEAGRLIRRLSEKTIRHNHAMRMIYKALGYVDYHDAVKHNGTSERFENLNFDRKDLVGINQDVNTQEEAIYEAVAAYIRPYFDRVFALPREKEWFAGERCTSTGQFMHRLRPYVEHLGWQFDDIMDFWAIGHAFAFRYPHACNLQTKKDMFRHAKRFGTRKQVFDASRRLAGEMDRGPKPVRLL